MRLAVLKTLPVAILAAVSALTVFAAEPGPSLSEQIDQHIAAARLDYEQIAAPVADDAEFLRRVYLDLTGTIPSVDQARTFFADTAPDKRAKVVDQLLAGAEYARHMQREFDVLLMRRLPSKHVPVAEWEKFLFDSFNANKPWDEVVRAMFTNDGSDPANRGPARFLLDREADITTVTRDISKLFLGANLECAQCHDHPQVDDFKQRHYYGVAAFFNRSFVFAGKDKPVVLAEKGDGEVTFESVFEMRDKTSTGPKSTPPRLFTSAAMSEPTFGKPEESYLVAPADNVRPVPRYSRRSKFAEVVVSAENRRFVRTTVNRIWAMLLGHGIVHPVDFDHTANKPSHPALLAHLTEEFAANGLDLKKLIRAIVLSKTYQRSSRMPEGKTAPPEDAFAQGQLKPLSPSQLCYALLQGTGQADTQRIALGANLNEESLFKALSGNEVHFVQLYGGLPGKPVERFESTAAQVLFFSNNPVVLNLLPPQNGNLSDRMLKLPADNPKAVAEELYITSLTRLPTAEEAAEVEQYLAGLQGGDRNNAVYELVWAAVSSAEFRLNH
jgi:hypothetical protein